MRECATSRGPPRAYISRNESEICRRGKRARRARVVNNSARRVSSVVYSYSYRIPRGEAKAASEGRITRRGRREERARARARFIIRNQWASNVYEITPPVGVKTLPTVRYRWFELFLSLFL